MPSASLMVIEHAERFGLAQLHQLRGRMGRGAAASVCVLLDDLMIIVPGVLALALAGARQAGRPAS